MPKDLLTLESVRPGQTAKGSFKNSKSKGKVPEFSVRGHEFRSIEMSLNYFTFWSEFAFSLDYC